MHLQSFNSFIGKSHKAQSQFYMSGKDVRPIEGDRAESRVSEHDEERRQEGEKEHVSPVHTSPEGRNRVCLFECNLVIGHFKKRRY